MKSIIKLFAHILEVVIAYPNDLSDLRSYAFKETFKTLLTFTKYKKINITKNNTFNFAVKQHCDATI